MLILLTILTTTVTSLTKLFMPYPVRSCANIDYITPIICHVIQRKNRNNMVSDDVDASSKIKFFDSKVCTTKPDSTLCMVKVSNYYDIVSIIVVEFIDIQRNDNETIFLSIELFG